LDLAERAVSRSVGLHPGLHLSVVTTHRS
jgi:hypothetical protein